MKTEIKEIKTAIVILVISIGSGITVYFLIAFILHLFGIKFTF